MSKFDKKPDFVPGMSSVYRSGSLRGPAPMMASTFMLQIGTKGFKTIKEGEHISVVTLAEVAEHFEKETLIYSGTVQALYYGASRVTNLWMPAEGMPNEIKELLETHRGPFLVLNECGNAERMEEICYHLIEVDKVLVGVDKPHMGGIK